MRDIKGGSSWIRVGGSEREQGLIHMTNGFIYAIPRPCKLHALDITPHQTASDIPYTAPGNSRRCTSMSDIFRKSVLNRLPAMPPTKAPWAAGDDDTMEELDGEDEEEDGIQELGAVKSFTQV
jgi:hypothetical protein